MYKVRNIYTGEILTVYGVNPGGSFMFFIPPEPGQPPTWIWLSQADYEPLEDGV